MRATIIVRSLKEEKIAALIESPSIDEETERKAVNDLERKFPRDSYCIDTSQIVHARNAMKGRAA